MTLNKAINRLSWRFSKCDNINPVQEDIDSFNTILEYIEESKKEVLSQNLLFAKLYMAVLKRSMQHYDADILNNTPQKELHKFLEKPIEWHYQNFTDYLNQESCISSKDCVNLAWTLEDVRNNLNIQMTQCLIKYSEK